MKARQATTTSAAHPLWEAIARLTTEETFHDVVFVVGEERIGAVRNLIAARSDHWERAFYGQCRESAEREVFVCETDPQTFRHLLHFVYTDQLPAVFDLPIAPESEAADKAKRSSPFDLIYALWELAERYNLPDLKALLLDRLQDHLSITQPVRLLELVGDRKAGMPDGLCEQLHGAFEAAFARNVGLHCLLETFDKVLTLSPALDQLLQPLRVVVDGARAACVAWIRDNGRELMTALVNGDQLQRQWLNASAALVEAVLSCQILDVYELQVFRALAAWWRHDVDGRTLALRKMVPRVLQTPLLTYSDLADDVEPSGALSMEQLMDAYKIVARHTRINFSHTLTPGGAARETRTHDARGLEWQFTLQVSDTGRMCITPHSCVTGLRHKTSPFTASVFVGRKRAELAMTTDNVAQSIDVSAFMARTAMVTILFCCYP
jgi:hypothetical protein